MKTVTDLSWEDILDLMDRVDTMTMGNARFLIHPDGEILCRTEEDASCVADFIESFTMLNILTHEIEKDEGDWYPYTWTVYPD